MIWEFLAMVVWAVAGICCKQLEVASSESAVASSIRRPTGYFVMQQVSGENVSDAKLSSPKWARVVILQRWPAVQLTPTKTDWKFIDEQVA
jgi:hypothetical protein